MANIKTGVIFFTEPKATGLDLNGNRNLTPLFQVPQILNVRTNRI